MILLSINHLICILTQFKTFKLNFVTKFVNINRTKSLKSNSMRSSVKQSIVTISNKSVTHHYNVMMYKIVVCGTIILCINSDVLNQKGSE